jgi:hypothetical protein
MMARAMLTGAVSSMKNPAGLKMLARNKNPASTK